MEPCSLLRGSLDERRIWGRMDTCICMDESLCCSPEIITPLLIGCTPIQNAFGVNKNKILKISQAGRISTWEGKAGSWKACGFVSPPPNGGVSVESSTHFPVDARDLIHLQTPSQFFKPLLSF